MLFKSARLFFLFIFSFGLFFLSSSEVKAQTGRSTATKVCGETCSSDNDCKASTVSGITAVCRQGKCVNLECYNLGAPTVFGTRCDCNNAVHKCGEECGADIGLCASGYSCTYRSQNQCGAEHGVCVPSGTGEAARGPMSGVPAYNGSYFLRRACGSTTTDPQNNYIYHASFPNHVFNNAEIKKYMCSPATPTPAPLVCEVSSSKGDISLYPLGSAQLTANVTAKSGNKNVAISSAKVDFTSNNAIASVSPSSDSSKPYQTTVKALNRDGSSNIRVNATVKISDQRQATCNTKVAVTVKELSCISKAQCVAENEGNLLSGGYVKCSMATVAGVAPSGGHVEYQGRCERKLGSESKEKFNLVPSGQRSPVFQRFQVKTGNYHCEFRYCIKNSQGESACMDWEPGTINI